MILNFWGLERNSRMVAEITSQSRPSGSSQTWWVLQTTRLSHRNLRIFGISNIPHIRSNRFHKLLDRQQYMPWWFWWYYLHGCSEMVQLTGHSIHLLLFYRPKHLISDRCCCAIDQLYCSHSGIVTRMDFLGRSTWAIMGRYCNWAQLRRIFQIHSETWDSSENHSPGGTLAKFTANFGENGYGIINYISRSIVSSPGLCYTHQESME